MDLPGVLGGFLDDKVIELKATAMIYYPWMEPTVLAAFAFINSIRIFAYVPQVLKAARDKNGAKAISDATWLLFLASHVTTILYALFSLGDAVMAIIFTGNAVACIGILGVTAYKRRQYRRAMTSSS